MTARETGLPPILGENPRVLILGSFPSRMSLDRQWYYANPRNHFWPVMKGLFALGGDDPAYLAESLKSRGIAVWDVISSRRFQPGSMDRDIREETFNDIAGLVTSHPSIHFIGLNGTRAWDSFRRAMRKSDLPAPPAARRLPSTSPANARYTLARKVAAWRVILEILEGAGEDRYFVCNPGPRSTGRK
jgi:TDG/mug DNA glycosylase family protein